MAEFESLATSPLCLFEVEQETFVVTPLPGFSEDDLRLLSRCRHTGEFASSVDSGSESIPLSRCRPLHLFGGEPIAAIEKIYDLMVEKKLMRAKSTVDDRYGKLVAQITNWRPDVRGHVEHMLMARPETHVLVSHLRHTDSIETELQVVARHIFGLQSDGSGSISALKVQEVYKDLALARRCPHAGLRLAIKREIIRMDRVEDVMFSGFWNDVPVPWRMGVL